MSEVKWIKLSTGIFDNRKIRQIEEMPDGDALIVIWMKLLVLAADVNDGGLVYFTRDLPYTDQLLATQFHRSTKQVQLAMQTFEMFGMIEIVDDIFKISNWEKYQNEEGLSKIREQNRLRKQAQRERERAALPPASRDSHVTVTGSHATDIDKEKEKEKETDFMDRPRSTRFTPPTVEEVSSYCQERKNGIDAQRFVDYYESRGWMLGKTKMKDWRAAVRTWERGSDKSAITANTTADVKQDDLDAILKKLKGGS